MRTIGIDVGGSTVKAAGLSDGRIEWTAQSNAYDHPTRQELIDAIRDAAGRHGEGIAAVGLCVPGLLDRANRRVTFSVNVPALAGVVLDDLVREALRHCGDAVPMTLCNDAHAAAVDIVQSSSLSGRVIVIALGTGVGMAALDDGVPLRVEADSPGHIGQVDVSIDDDAPIGPDGGAGSLEAYIGSPALKRRYGSVQQFIEQAGIDAPPIRALARAIRICHAIYRPQHIVLAGGIGIRMQRIVQPLAELVESNLTNIARSGWTLRCGEHDFHAAIGASRLAAIGINQVQQDAPDVR